MPRYGYTHKFKKGQQFRENGSTGKRFTVDKLLFGGKNVGGEEELFYDLIGDDLVAHQTLGEHQIEGALRRGSWRQEPLETAKVAEADDGWELVDRKHSCVTSNALRSGKFSAGDTIRCTACGQHWEVYMTNGGTSWNPSPVHLAARKVASNG